MRVKIRRIEQRNHRVPGNWGKEANETLISTDGTEKKLIISAVLSVEISASVVKFVTNHSQNL